jgi:hypothetical protein
MKVETVKIVFQDAPERPSKAALGLESYEVQSLTILEAPKGYEIKVGPAEVMIPVVVAYIAAGAGVIGAAIAGVCAVYGSRNNAKIVLKGAKGASIEVPANSTAEEIAQFIVLAKSLDAPEIEIINLTPPAPQEEPQSEDTNLADDEFFP